MGEQEACLWHFLNYTWNFKEPQRLYGGGRSSTGENSEIYTPRLLHNHHGKELPSSGVLQSVQAAFLSFCKRAVWVTYCMVYNVCSEQCHYLQRTDVVAEESNNQCHKQANSLVAAHEDTVLIPPLMFLSHAI